MESFEKWTANHGWLFWIALVFAGAVPGSIPGIGPFLYLAAIGLGIWWQQQSRRRHPRFAALSPQPRITVDTSQNGGRGFARPNSMANSSDEVAVVGTGYYEGWGLKRGNGQVLLVRQPHNEYDTNAVAVVAGGRQIGHLPRKRAVLISPLLDSGGHDRLEAKAYFDDEGVVVTLPKIVQPRLDPHPSGVQLQPLQPWGRCDDEVEVDFEADHREGISAVFRCEGVAISSEGTVLRKVPALLVPSLHPSAPAVTVHGYWVGNVMPGSGPSIAGMVSGLASNAHLLLVEANVWALNDRGTIRSNVRLRVPDSRELHAPGPMPNGAHILLPRGSKVQVTGEEKYLNEVSVLLEGEPTQPAVATLHIAPPTTRRSVKERIEVRIYDEIVGQLTPYMSEHFLPLVKVCDEEGVTVACHAEVRGNQLKADVELDSVKAAELSDEWIAEHVYGADKRFL